MNKVSDAGQIVARLCELHGKMLDAVKRQRPYPVRIALGASDVATVLDAAIAIERLRALTKVEDTE